MIVKLPDRWLNMDYFTNAITTDDGLSLFYVNGGGAIELKYTGDDARQVKQLLVTLVNTDDEYHIERDTKEY